MFAIRKVEISDKQHKVLNICLSDTNLKKLSSCNYTTLILGENGVGKSFLLKSIIVCKKKEEKIRFFLISSASIIFLPSQATKAQFSTKLSPVIKSAISFLPFHSF